MTEIMDLATVPDIIGGYAVTESPAKLRASSTSSSKQHDPFDSWDLGASLLLWSKSLYTVT